MSNTLELNSLSVTLGGREVLHRISLTASAGRVLAIVGPNGSGKSTLLRAMLGIVKASGSISWHGSRLASISPAMLARQVAYLAQSPTAPPTATVRELLLLGRFPHSRWPMLETSDDAQLLAFVSRQLEIEHFLHSPLEQLSGGQRQLCHLGRALMQQPKALLLDEPDTFLDLSHLARLKALLHSLSRQDQMTVILASHDLPLAQAVADDAVVLSAGRVAAAGPADVVFSPDVLASIYGVKFESVIADGRRVVIPIL